MATALEKISSAGPASAYVLPFSSGAKYCEKAKPFRTTSVLLVKSPYVEVMTMAELVGTSSRLVAVVGPMKVSAWTSADTKAMKTAIEIRAFIKKTFKWMLAKESNAKTRRPQRTILQER